MLQEVQTATPSTPRAASFSPRSPQEQKGETPPPSVRTPFPMSTVTPPCIVFCAAENAALCADLSTEPVCLSVEWCVAPSTPFYSFINLQPSHANSFAGKFVAKFAVKFTHFHSHSRRSPQQSSQSASSLKPSSQPPSQSSSQRSAQNNLDPSRG